MNLCSIETNNSRQQVVCEHNTDRKVHHVPSNSVEQLQPYGFHPHLLGVFFTHVNSVVKLRMYSIVIRPLCSFMTPSFSIICCLISPRTSTYIKWSISINNWEIKFSCWPLLGHRGTYASKWCSTVWVMWQWMELGKLIKWLWLWDNTKSKDWLVVSCRFNTNMPASIK